MNVELRPGTAADAEACGRICFEAFAAIAEAHGFPPDFPDVPAAVGVIGEFLGQSGVYSVVAEMDGRVVGSNFLSEHAPIAGVGPITIDPEVQNGAIGRALMVDVLERARREGYPGVRLVQAAYHGRSLALYTRLGFVVREPLAALQGQPPESPGGSRSVRPATERDLEAAAALARRVHGFDRSAELAQGIGSGSAMVVEYDGRVTGYTTSVAFFGHSCAESNDDLKVLIAAAPEFGGPGFLLPIRNAELFRWCLEQRLRVVQTMTLMSLGLYNEPQGVFLPSVLY